MDVKDAIFLLFLLGALPFIIYSFIADLNRRQFAILAAIAMLLGFLVSTRRGRAALSWLTEPERLLPLLSLIGVIVVGLFIWRVVSARAQRRGFTWSRKPSQRDFAAACYDHLIRRGWTHRADISRASVHAYWMQLDRERVTFIVLADLFHHDFLERTFSASRVTPTKKVMVVLWERPSEAVINLLEGLKWQFMTAEDFKKPNADYSTQSESNTRPIVAESEKTSWALLKDEHQDV